MPREFDFVKASNLFVVGNTGVRIDPEAYCEHGATAAAVFLFGARQRTPESTQRIDTIVPRCVMAELIGTLQAQIRRTDGEAALSQFLDDVDTFAAEADTALEQLHTERRDCCEAGFRTHGREHTCGEAGGQR
ncbi:hypothetical protein [Streptomyces sp. 049-1]|uniref:hypothetical protein n=1 Tax=Streptomyces sp. 049-1 TaxID=2789264 RepID=UPI00397FB66B